MELSPNYAGTLMGMTTMLANMTGFIGPLFAGAVTDKNVSTTFNTFMRFTSHLNIQSNLNITNSVVNEHSVITNKILS
jgi:hypothetical protein